MTKFSMALMLGCALIAPPALAEEKRAAPVVEASSPEAQTQAAPAPMFAEANAITDKKLATIAGREDVNQFTQSDQANSVEGNSVGDNSNTGTIVLSDNAFRNINGITILNANTGNNVAINASVQINIAVPAE